MATPEKGKAIRRRREKVECGFCPGLGTLDHLYTLSRDRISRRSHGVEGFRFGNLRIGSLLFADDVVLLALLTRDLQVSMDWFAAECEVAGMRISTSKSEANGYQLEKRWREEEILPQVEEFKYLEVLFTSKGKMKREMNRRTRDRCSICSDADPAPFH